MKKVLFFIIAMVCAVTGARADAITVSTDSNGLTTVNCTDDENDEVTVTGDFPTPISNLKIVGPFSTAISDKIANTLGNNTNSFTRLDLSEATVVTTTSLSTYSLVMWTKMGYIKHLILPQGASVPTATQLKSNTDGSLDKWDHMEYFVIPQADGTCDIYLTEEGLTSISASDVIVSNKTTNTVSVYLADGEDEYPATKATKTAIETYLKNQGYKLYVPKYTFSGCEVTINMDAAEGQTLADLIARAKDKVVEGGQTGICTLTVSGELSTNDIAVTLSNSDMAGATRIDLSGATLASGVILTSLNIPSTLTSLVLPKGETVSPGLATKLAAATGLMYAYSPTSSDQNGSQAVADYVWVNKAGGMFQALDTEAMLKTSHYIKVASSVVLNAADMDYSGHSITGLEYLDLSDANLIPSVSETYKKPHDNAYRIVLPDNRTPEQMAIYARNPNAGSLAAVYSYEGTKLKVLEINDDAYFPSALSNPKIVHEGTTALEVVSYNDGQGNQYGNFGNFNSTNSPKILAGINSAASSIKTVILNNVWTSQNLTFTNTNITELQIIGIRKHYSADEGPAINVDGCTALTKLSITDSKLASLDASVATLSNVSLAGTSVAGAVDLSNSGVATFTNATKVTGNLNLTNTRIVNFAATGEVDGDIIFNASTNLATIDLTSITLGSSSKIHIHKTDSESDTNVLDKLNIDNKYTITVPNGFVKADRLHPYSTDGTDVLDDNIAVVAAASGNTDTDDCSITYDSATKIATVHATKDGHFANLMASSYEGFPVGTTFKFDAASKINENDLKALAGTIIKSDNTQSLDANWRSNYYYVDLFDIVADEATCDNTKGAIGKAIEWMRDNNRQFKGLILPKNHTQYGSGTTLIKDADNAETPVATCSEFIAYYKTKEENGSDATKKMTVAHVYNQSNSSDGYQASFDKMSSLLRLHDDVTGANSGKGTDVFLVSTNSINKLNIDNMVAKASSIEVVNNEMVASTTEKASIYVYPKVAGDFTGAVTATALYNTPTDLLKIEGPISAGISTALNSFTNGPRVLDLKNIAAEQATDEFISTLLAALTNNKIEYIILPEGMQKSTVCRTYSSSMTSLKAVISSSATNLVAHVQKPGSLAEARYLATGGSISTETGMISPATTGLTTVTLSGSLNASDLFANNTGHVVDTDGHWTTGDNTKPMALSGEQGTITTIDLKDAVFPTQTDMNLSFAGLSSLRNVTLPTSESMKIIPAHCLDNITTLTELCVPFNYEIIEDGAFWLTSINHITTTDAIDGAVIDNGPLSYTLSTNLKRLGITPSPVTNAITCPIFPQNMGVLDIYSMAAKTPLCYKNVFPANSCDGWGGFIENMPYCRDKYFNGGDPLKSFAVLHFPSQDTYNATSESNRESSYEDMKMFYTDVNKHFTKLEQTGAVDANGDEIAWPTLEEVYRTYNQASLGLTWNDWEEKYSDQGIPQVNGGQPKVALENGVYSRTSEAAGTGDGDYNFDNYAGWHQLVLSLATYFEPAEKKQGEKIVREYEEAGYYTFCIPFNMTNEQVVKMLGVPAGDGENVICKLYDSKGTLINGDVRSDMMPEIRQLSSVTRKKGENGEINKVTLRMTPDLVNANHIGYTAYLDITYPEGVEKHRTIDAEEYNSTSNFDDRLCLIGGRPYIIKAYKRRQIENGVDLYKIKKQNLGQYVLEHYADEFGIESSIVQNTKYPEYLTYEQLKNNDNQELLSLRFAKPYENHKVQAIRDGESGVYLTYDSDENGKLVTKKYYYTMIGQFWQQPLPMYSLYMSRGNWYRYTGATDTEGKRYTWDPYKCVIMATVEVSGTKGAGYRNESASVYPEVEANTKDKLNDTFKLQFLDGRNDDDFDKTGTYSRYIFSFDDDIVELDEEGNEVTAIQRLDGEYIAPANVKVYNVAGQYVGESLDGLTKGLYIVNGKKIVIK